ncbi:MAG: hypothetical protein Q8Q54_15240 [Methylococcales bacterium]|nr:hypothetical protein [Methylococcales bacterium]MDP3840270.1 hypothetical protein [Methylococcales bacterium]
MIELIAFAIFAAFIWFFLKNYNKKSDSTTTVKPAAATPVKQEAKPAEPVVAPAEKTETPVPVATAAVVIESQPVSAQDNSLLPQDSMLKRHYLTHVHAMMTAISPARPTEPTLARHYDTQLTADIAQCLNDEVAMEKLIAQYAACQKTAACPAPVTAVEEVQVAEPEAIIEPAVQIETAVESITTAPQHEVSNIPTDSTLRRHYLAHLRTQVAATMTPRPTDATLGRHYDAMLAYEVEQQLSK